MTEGQCCGGLTPLGKVCSTPFVRFPRVWVLQNPRHQVGAAEEPGKRKDEGLLLCRRNFRLKLVGNRHMHIIRGICRYDEGN
eukprot:9503851-Pyramimonas_sp.AAC.7